MTVKQTAGHDALGEFAPEFAHLNDDVLFGEVWSREAQLPLKLRSIVTVSTLIGKGITDSSLKYHLASARQNGVTREEMAEILTHAAFYAGWPNAWAAFNMAKEVYADDAARTDGHGGFFGLGTPNTAFACTSSVKAILRRSPIPMITCPSTTLRLSRDAATTGTSTTQARAAARCWSALTARAGTRKRASPHSACIPAISSRFRQTLSTGTAPQPTAGSATWPLSSRAKTPATSGSSPWTTKPTAPWRRKA